MLRWRWFSPRAVWRRITLGLAALLGRDAEDHKLDAEMRHFLDEAVAELVAGGASPAEARRLVHQRWGDGLAEREQVRAYGWDGALELVLADLRLAVRRLARTPGFTLVATLTLGIGIGAATAVFSAASPVLFRALPYPDPDRIVSVAARADDGAPQPVAFGTYLELAERTRAAGVFEAVAPARPWAVTLTGAGEPRRLDGQRVGAAYFDVLGVVPALGRGFDAADDHAAGPRSVVLTDGLWRRAFGADAGVVGRGVQLDGVSHQVAGVLPRAFDDVRAPGVEIYTLLQYDHAAAASGAFEGREWGNHLDLVARLSGDGSTKRALEGARGALAAVAADRVAEYPRPTWASLEAGVAVRPLGEVATAEARPLMIALLSGVALVLGVTCANLVLLLLARTARRRPEFAMRVALGAARGRLIRSLLAESLVLATLGGALGVLLARAGVGALVMMAPPTLPRLGDVALDPAALGFALVLTTAVGLLAGLVPVLTRSGGVSGDRAGASLTAATSGLARGSAGGGARTRGVLVALEVAMAVVLLVGAGLLFRTTTLLLRSSPGFDATGAAVLQVHATGMDGGDAALHAFFDQSLDAARALPGVADAALTSQLPLSGEAEVFGVRLDEPDRPEGSDGPAFRYAVSPGYFDVMGIPLLQGRAFEHGDREDAPPVAVIGQTLARRLFGGEAALGRRIRVGGGGEPFTVVGVVGDVKQATLAAAEPAAVYLSARQWHWADASRWLVVRRASGSTASPVALVPALRQAVWSVDGDQPVVRAGAFDELVAASEVRRRFALLVLSAFAISALLLAAVGLYGVLSGAVTARTRELGVRVALGASHDRIVALVVRRGMALIALGLATGLAGSLAAGRLLSSLLYGVSPLDPVTYAAVVGVVAAAGVVACWVPARRAARVDPLVAMRAE
jgi:putative ABC transport system permease protein